MENVTNIWLERRNSIVEYLTKGYTIRYISEKFNISQSRMYQILDMLDIDIKKIVVHQDELIKRYGEQETLRLRKNKIRNILFISHGIKDHSMINIILDNLDYPDKCPIFDIDLNYGSTKDKLTESDNNATVTRICDSKSYTESGNVIVISYKANKVLKRGTLEELKKIIDFIQEKRHNLFLNEII